MNPFQDFKNYRAPQDNPFVLFTEGECAVILACVLALGFIIGRWA